MATHRWHYCREALAVHYLETLKTGPQSLAIFAERRKGKTEFCKYDLIPHAESQGYRCVYINFWQDKANPSACVVESITNSLERDLTGILRGWKKEVSLKLGALQDKISKNPVATPSTANEAFSCLLRTKEPILLICDEVQHLATNPAFEDFTASLRTFIDSNKDRTRVVFTGSSQDNLNRLFRRQKAAFYNSAPLTPFHDMGEEFIKFLTDLFYSLTKRKLPAKDIMKTYINHHYSPAFIVELLQVMVRDGYYDMESGLDYYLSLNPPDQEHELTWKNINALDKEVLKLIATQNDPQLYSSSTLEKIRSAIGVAVKKGTVQASLKKLRELGVLLNSGRGEWEFENSSFKEYVLLQL